MDVHGRSASGADVSAFEDGDRPALVGIHAISGTRGDCNAQEELPVLSGRSNSSLRAASLIARKREMVWNGSWGRKNSCVTFLAFGAARLKVCTRLSFSLVCRVRCAVDLSYMFCGWSQCDH